MRQQPGVTHQAQCNTIGKAFSLFITPEMIDLLVLETNREARRKITQWNNDTPENQKQPRIRLDSTEMKAFTGLFLLAGIYKCNHEQVKFNPSGVQVKGVQCSQQVSPGVDSVRYRNTYALIIELH